MSYRALLEDIINEAKSEKARAAILATLGDRISDKLKSGTDAISKKYRDDVLGFLLWVESCDPTPKSLYTDWLIRLFLSGAFRYAEDIGKATDLLVRYEELKPKLPLKERDIGFFKSFHVFSDFIDGHSGTDARSESQKDRDTEAAYFAHGYAELYYDSPEIKVVIPKTQEASQWFGRNTRWCTAAKSNNMFDDYNQDGPLYIILFKRTNTRWQFHLESSQFMDEKDEELRFEQIKSVIHLFDLPVEKNGYLIQFIDNPNEEMKLAAVRSNGGAIRYIDNPSEEMKLAAVRSNGLVIKWIDNPSEAIQLAAVHETGRALRYIDNPSETVQLAAVKQNGNAIKNIDNPSEVVKLAAVQQDGRAILYIKNPSEAVRQFSNIASGE